MLRNNQSAPRVSIIRRNTIKGTLFAVIALAVGLTFPVAAQQQDTQEVTKALKALLAEEDEMIQKKDAAGCAALYTADAFVVFLAPKLAVKQGHEAIQKHYQAIIDAGATNMTSEVEHLEMRGNDVAWAAGPYSVTVKGKTIEGNWSGMLKREGGTWKWASVSAARGAVCTGGTC
jgi:uncharacterized protein (TIGR02246 family)